MRWTILVVIAAATLTGGCGSEPGEPTDRQDGDERPAAADRSAPIQRIAFGSCAQHRQPQPIWDAVRAVDPQVFVFLGDNVYADTTDMAELRDAYGMLAAKPGFKKLRTEATILATWDDHDYGKNDAGAGFEAKAGSQEVFLDFFGEPEGTRRRTTPGVYDAEVFGPAGKRVQFILLDTRYFRSPLTRWPDGQRPRGEGPYIASDDESRTLLGDAQWQWLQRQLEKPADLRIIASSIQFVAEDHHWEKWANLPHERKRMLELIERTEADGVLFISGDRHFAELSVLDEQPPYPIYDLTSSSLNSSLNPRQEANRHRVGEPVFADNFGLIEVDWSANDPSVTMQILDEAGEVHLSHEVRLSELRHR